MEFIRINPHTKEILETMEYTTAEKYALDNKLKIKILSKNNNKYIGYILTRSEYIKQEKLDRIKNKANVVNNKTVIIKPNTGITDLATKSQQILNKYFKPESNTHCILYYKFHHQVPPIKIDIYIEAIKKIFIPLQYKYKMEKSFFIVQIK